MLYSKLNRLVIFPVICLLFIPIFSIAQDTSFDMEITAVKEEIGDLTYNGYSTEFALSEEELQRRWWKYSKSLGIVENMKTHYMIRIPSSEKGMSPVTLVEKATGEEKTATIFLAVLDQTDNTFKEQVRDVLMEFKIQYYVGIIEAQIREKEVEMEKVSTAYTAEVAGNQKAGKSVGTGSARQSLQKLTQLAYELEALKRSLNKIR